MKFANISMCLMISAVLSGCAAVPAVKDNKASGSFQGVTGDGLTIVLTSEPQEQGFTANGAVDGQSVVFSGTELWRSLGALMYTNGSFAAAEFGLIPDGENLPNQLKLVWKAQPMNPRGPSILPGEASAIQTTSLVAIGGKPTTWAVSFSATDTDENTAVAKVGLVVPAQPIL